MFKEKATPADAVACSVVRGTGAADRVHGGGVFTLQCFDKDGNLKWEESADNLVVNVGLDDMNTQYFTGSGYSPTWYLGLIEGPASGTSIAASDTLASHAGWTEVPYSTGYSGNRKAVTFGGATTADPSVISNSGSAAQFVMSGTYVVAGAFLCNAATGTSGLLFSASDFQSPGDRSVVSGDTLNVTYTFSLAAT
jgi:hypothetical protein